MTQYFINWFYNLLTGFSGALAWLVSPITIGDLQVSPLGIISFGGLTAFIAVAIVKWVVS